MSYHTDTLLKINNLCASNMWNIHINTDSIDKLQDTVITFQKDLETNHEKMKKMIKGIKEKQTEM